MIHLGSRPMLERDEELAELGLAAREAASGLGSIVLIEGEAGIGKSSLVDAIRSALPAEGRLLLGWCDDLATPRVLGPLRDLRESVGTGLTAALDSGDRGRVGEALLAELSWPGHASVLVIEDAHWIDEATLDVLRYLARRIERHPAVLVLTLRDELALDHPLRPLLGLASRSPRLRRLRLSRLSRHAVRRLGSGSAMDLDKVYRLTSGNPFLVAEVLASGDLGRVPPSIAEAVTARLSDLDTTTRSAVEQLAVVPSAVERWLVEAVVPDGLRALETAERRGVLAVSPARVAFRHELTRQAVVASLPAVRRVSANQAVLAALLHRHADRAVDLSRIVHHAAEAGDEAAIIRYGPLAQQEAVSAGSHREAVAHGRLALRYRSAFAPAELAEILERQAVACYTVGLGEEAVAAQEEVVALRRAAVDTRALGASLRWLSRMAWWAGDRSRAEECAAKAIDVLADAGDEPTLALALSNESQLHMLAGHFTQALAVGDRAVSMARRLVDPGLLSHALTNIGVASWSLGRPEGEALLEEALGIALEAREVEHASRAYVSLATQFINHLQFDRALAMVEAGIDLAEEAEFVGFLRYLRAVRGTVDIARADWAEAERDAEWGMVASICNRCPSLAVAGRARSRRGDPEGHLLLQEAFALAARLREAQRLGPAGSALVEAAWLRGDTATALATVLPWYDEVYRHGFRGVAAELGFWLRLAGEDVPVVPVEHPYVWLAHGDWQRAADAWQAAGCAYEQAQALSCSPDQADVLRALSMLDGIGAVPLARIVRARLRDLGVARIPRGPASATRDNPVGLTDRQVEVLRLLAEGLTNGEIAARLVLSRRTVDTHVAAILTKLDAPTRRDAARRAVDLGLQERAGS